MSLVSLLFAHMIDIAFTDVVGNASQTLVLSKGIYLWGGSNIVYGAISHCSMVVVIGAI